MMICPNCNYKHGHMRKDKEDKEIVGCHGDFLGLSNGTHAIKYGGAFSDIKHLVLFCPACKLGFIGDKL